MPEKKFPTSGSLSMANVFPKFGTTSLRAASQKLGLTAPDAFPNDFYGKVYLQIQDTILVSSTSQGLLVNVKVYTNWTLSSNVSWITFTNSSGNGGSSIGVNVSKNTGAQRTGTVTLTSNGESVTMTVTLKKPISIGVEPALLAYSPYEASICTARTRTYYLPTGKNLFSASKIYSNSTGSTLALVGYYRDGFVYRYWNGTNFGYGQLCQTSIDGPDMFK